VGHRSGMYLLWSIFVGGVLLMLGYGALIFWRFSLGDLELSAARSRWAARPFSHYRMELAYGRSGYCKQSIEIAADHVVAILQNTCTEPPPTVEQLFDRIERDLVTINGHCGPNGCACDGTIVVSASYDTRLGYPLSKHVDLDPAARWRFPEYWERQLSGGYCSYRELTRDIITVESLTPMT
jgi:Family of unknown function (DUF6174)